MTSRDFAYWLQGIFELGNINELDEKQTKIIKNHLNMVFAHDIDPSMGDKAHQGKLQALHQGSPFPTELPSHLTAKEDVPGGYKVRC